VDERAFNLLRQMRAGLSGPTLMEFKQILREQFFALLLDQDGALAALSKMLPANVEERVRILHAIRQVISASGELAGERAERLAQIERLFEAVDTARPVAMKASSSASK
jgi:hypothetical protein